MFSGPIKNFLSLCFSKGKSVATALRNVRRQMQLRYWQRVENEPLQKNDSSEFYQNSRRKKLGVQRIVEEIAKKKFDERK